MTTKLWTPADLTDFLDFEHGYCAKLIAAGKEVMRHVVAFVEVDGRLEPTVPVFLPVVPREARDLVAQIIFAMCAEHDVVIHVGEAWMTVLGEPNAERVEIVNVDFYTKAGQWQCVHRIDRATRTLACGTFVELQLTGADAAHGRFVRPLTSH